jgi:hypothetical protein
MTGERPVIAIAGADAHARIGTSRTDPYEEDSRTLPSAAVVPRVSNRVM